MIVSKIQTSYSSVINPTKICSFEIEFIDAPTITLIHSSARFLYLKKGKGTISVNGIEYKIVENCMIAIIPWDVTKITEVEEPLEFYKIIYNSNFINGYLRTIYNPTSSKISIFKDISNHPVTLFMEKEADKILECIMDLKDECGSEGIESAFESNALSNTYIISLLIRMMVIFLRMSKQNYISIAANKELNDINDIFRYIYSHLQEKITLEKLSKIFFMSESTIYNHLQLNLGFTFNELLNEMRITKSLDLLMYSDMSLQEISETVGYADASHFIRSFVSKHNVTPKEYRKAYQNTDEIIRKKEESIAFKVLEYIGTHFLNDKFNAISTAKHFNINVTDLNYIIMFQMEKTFDDYVEWLRISKACELLITTDLAITDIAIEVGYNTTRTFQRAFTRIRKVSPGHFRRTVAYQSIDGTIIEKEK
ncbi:AraC family transcriptional regulator [Erysipelotrichaceae bacterium OH741_COT-311]|nr:AraC family transcriptional regulator [Erysipelotrichaceae bacterium]RRC92182.1 AraC family transcriptional regulator [Erysipelotrichaceae bacterium OH741_COT-311]